MYSQENASFMYKIEDVLRDNKVFLAHGFHYLIQQNIEIFEQEHYQHDKSCVVTYRGHNNSDLEFIGVIRVEYSKEMSYVIRLSKRIVKFQEANYYEPYIQIDRYEKMELNEYDLDKGHLEYLSREWNEDDDESEEELEINYINSQIEMYQNLLKNRLKGDKNEQKN